MTNAVDEIFDLAAEPAASNETATEAEVASTEESTALYPNVLRTINADEYTPGTNPEGTLSIPEFAAHVTIENFKGGNLDPSAVVKDQAIYAAVKAKRYPLPVVLVLGAESTDPKDARVFVPVAEAMAAWQDRPARGEGSAAAVSARSEGDLLNVSAKKFSALGKLQARLDRLTAQVDKTRAQHDKYVHQLAQVARVDDDVAAQRIADKAAELDEAEADAASEANEIPDAA